MKASHVASKASTIAYLIEQGSDARQVAAKKMFGEYALYSGNKLVALVCDDQLFVKPTEAGRRHVGEVIEASPYPGAKPSFLIAGDRWEDRDWLSQLFAVTATELPEPAPKKKRR